MASKRYLVVNPFGIGDVIFTMPLVESLRVQDPGAFIGFVCNERTFELVRMNTAIDRTYIFNRDRIRKLWKKNLFLFYRKLSAFLALLKEDRFDVLVDLSLGREAGFYAWMIGIRDRAGFDTRGRGLFLTKKLGLDGYAGRPVAEIQMDLLSCLGFSRPSQPPSLSLRTSEAAQIAAAAFLKKSGFHVQDRFLAVAPGGGKSWGPNAVYKQWDPEFFAQAADDFCRARGGRTRVVLLGDRSEEALLEKVRGLIKTSAIPALGFTLEETAALLLKMEALLCNDGGLMHLANALNVKTVSVFGPVDEKVYGPYGGTAKREVLVEAVPCRPCYQKFYFPPCHHERRCLTRLPVARAVEALKKIA